MAEIPFLSRQDEFMLNKEAQTLLMKDNHAYQAKCEQKGSSSDMDYRWVRTVLSKGTLADKIAANTLLIQDSPRNNLDCIQHLVDMVNPKSKREALMAMDALKELFLSDLLKEHKLRPFAELVVGVDSKEFNARKQQLMDAYFEDQLRQMYRKYVESVEHFTHDSDSQTKSRAIKVMFELLSQNSEQEHYLLEKLINKLGDPEPRSSSLVVQLLTKLTNEHHPAMKEVIVKEVERVLYRSNISEKAQYAALCFLCSIKYVRGEFEVANRVVKVFLSFFRASIKKKSVNGRSMAIILSGLTRAHPFSNLEGSFMQEQLDTIYKVAHMVNFNVAIQAYSVIFAVITKDQSGYLGDRYSCALYRSLLEPNLDQCSRRGVYLNLLYKSMKVDSVGKRISAFVRRFLQFCLHQPPNIATGFIMLISSIFKDKPEVRTEFLANFNKLSVGNPILFDDDDEEEHYVDQEEEGEVNQKLTKKQKDSDAESDEDDEDDDDEEEEEEEVKDKKKKTTTTKEANKSKTSSWLHSRNLTKEKVKLTYDPLHRNPLYANADVSKPFELCLLRNHFHPTVAHFTDQMASGQRVQYDGDALYDFSVKSFLDKFVYKNPKKITKAEKKTSREKCVFERELRHKSQRLQINGPGYVSQTELQVPVEERFIYNFLKNKSSSDLDDNVSVNSDDFNDFVLTRFEKSFDDDLAADILTEKKKKRRSDDEDEEEEDYGEDDLEIDFDMDPDYKDALKDCAEDLGLDEIKANMNDEDLNAEGEGLCIDEGVSDQDDDEDDDEVDDKVQSKKKDRNLMDLFASADEFAHLLEDNEDFGDNDIGKEAEEQGGGDDDDEEDEDALDFDDDEETVAKRRNRTKARKEKLEKDTKIQSFKDKKIQKQEQIGKQQKSKFNKNKKFTSNDKFKKTNAKPNSNSKFNSKKRFNQKPSKFASKQKKART